MLTDQSAAQEAFKIFDSVTAEVNRYVYTCTCNADFCAYKYIYTCALKTCILMHTYLHTYIHAVVRRSYR